MTYCDVRCLHHDHTLCDKGRKEVFHSKERRLAMSEDQPKLVRYLDGNEEERGLASIDYWNNEIHYWDRRNKQSKMMASPYSFYRGTYQLYWYDFGQDERLSQFGNEHTITWLSGDYHAWLVSSSRSSGVRIERL